MVKIAGCALKKIEPNADIALAKTFDFNLGAMMQIKLDHVYAAEVQKAGFSNTRVGNSAPIGDALNESTLSAKANDLKTLLAKYDLRNITPRELAKLGGELYMRGEISDIAAGNFIGMGSNIDGTDPDVAIDAIAHFEFVYQAVNKSIEAGEAGLEFGLQYRKEGLHTIYNLENFIHSSRNEIALHEVV